MAKIKVFTVQKGNRPVKKYLSLSNAFDSLTDDKGRFAGIFKERWVLDFEFIDEAEVPKVCVDYENERRHHANMVELGFARGKFSLSKYEHEEILETA